MSTNPDHLKIKFGKWIELEASGRLAIYIGAGLVICILVWVALL